MTALILILALLQAPIITPRAKNPSGTCERRVVSLKHVEYRRKGFKLEDQRSFCGRAFQDDAGVWHAIAPGKSKPYLPKDDILTFGYGPFTNMQAAEDEVVKHCPLN